MATLFNQVKELEDNAETVLSGQVEEQELSSDDDYIKSLLNQKQHLQEKQLLSSANRTNGFSQERSSQHHQNDDQNQINFLGSNH